MKCPNCKAELNRKAIKKAINKGKCKFCSYKFKVGDFINWKEMKHTKKNE